MYKDMQQTLTTDSNHTIISCLCGCLIPVFKCDEVYYWVQATEARTHFRKMMKWDTKALRAVFTSRPVIDIPAPDLTVISTQQEDREGGRKGGGGGKREASGRWGTTNYNDNSPFLHASQMFSCHRQICLIKWSSGPIWQAAVDSVFVQLSAEQRVNVWLLQSF